MYCVAFGGGGVVNSGLTVYDLLICLTTYLFFVCVSIGYVV